MICLRCGHYTHPDAEMERVQGSASCQCSCHPLQPIPQSHTMTIQQMQEAITALGWQFVEHVFNDGKPDNCYIRFTKRKNWSAFHNGEDRIGWGRFERQSAWEQAYRAIVVEGRGDPALSPTPTPANSPAEPCCTDDHC